MSGAVAALPNTLSWYSQGHSDIYSTTVTRTKIPEVIYSGWHVKFAAVKGN
jgi:hypothetical protein